MKQKNLRYVLLTGVALVWGIIISKVIAALNQADPAIIVTNGKETTADSVPKYENFSLYANYPDPFIPETDTSTIDLIKSAGNSTNPGNQQQATLPVVHPPVKTDLSFIKYHGMIYNPTRKIKAALISINNKEITIKEKESAENITIKKIFSDKVQVLYNHKIYIIFKLN